MKVRMFALALVASAGGCDAAVAIDPKPVVSVEPGVDLTARGVGTVAVGGSGQAAAAQLTGLLGAPSAIRDTSACELAGPDAEAETITSWNAVSINAGRKSGRLISWTVQRGTVPSVVHLPYGVTTDTTVADALKRIPGAKGQWSDVFGVYQIASAKAPEMYWHGDNSNGTGRITMIASHLAFCE